MRARGKRNLWCAQQSMKHFWSRQGGDSSLKRSDRVCAGSLFLLALLECWLVPQNYTGRIWIFGTGLSLLFTAMLNLLRIRNGYWVRGLRSFCIGANVAMSVFIASLVLSIGRANAVENPQVLLTFLLLAIETVFSFARNE